MKPVTYGNVRECKRTRIKGASGVWMISCYILHNVNVRSQWETMLHCNVSHWLGTYTMWFLAVGYSYLSIPNTMRWISNYMLCNAVRCDHLSMPYMMYWTPVYLCCIINDLHQANSVISCQSRKKYPSTHGGSEKMAAILQITFSLVCSCMKIAVFWLEFNWNLFPSIPLTKCQHWSR